MNTLEKKGQSAIIKRLEPSSWWIGMKVPEVQLLVYGVGISAYDVEIDYAGIRILNIHKVQNPNYLFVDLLISDKAREGNFSIRLKEGGRLVDSVYFNLLSREEDSANREGFNSGDAIYLIMPDRFSCGNPNKEVSASMQEQNNRRLEYGRHGGDLRGIWNHLDYIGGLGFTAIWLNPVMENNQPESSYHGYAITDFYQIDSRLGSNEEFKELTKECQRRGIKMIMDMVFNHCGNCHWWMDDLPMPDWINQWEEFTRSNYRLSTISDPYVSDHDKKLSVKGWFDTHMPDLNLENKFLLKYMIQNSIWWIEYAGLGGIRMDTFPYPDKNAMAIWAQRIINEYPNFNIVGEAWIGEASKLCYWQKDFPNRDGYNSYLPALMDFPMQSAIKHAFNEAEGWDQGMARLYNMLADDHLYPDACNMVVFADNHDEGRIFHFLGEDIRKLKMVLTYLATIRGIPQIYYGTELLMNGDGAKGHAKIRKDFPGGWENDKTNAFIKKGRTIEQNEVFAFISKLFNYRKRSNALKYGKTLHFIPENGVYVYFRYVEGDCLMVVFNNNAKGVQNVKTNRFKEILSQYSKGRNVITGRRINDLTMIKIKAKSSLVIELG